MFGMKLEFTKVYIQSVRPSNHWNHTPSTKKFVLCQLITCVVFLQHMKSFFGPPGQMGNGYPCILSNISVLVNKEEL